jgi:hypothetical protein
MLVTEVKGRGKTKGVIREVGFKKNGGNGV